MGHQVIGEAENAMDALTYCERHRPEIILLDLILPDRFGIEIIDELRKINDSIKIVVITCLDQIEIDRKLSEKKCSAVIKKPFTSDEFKETMEDIISLS
jgi:DNA-binding NarL/FixJ family response regulator